jgi:Fic-DOC domain mobile mystery protein B
MSFDPPIPGQTPLDDLSGLRIRSIRTTGELNAAEAENIRRVVMKYLLARPSTRLAPFDARWMCKLHREMFADVWFWAGDLRRHQTNLGSPPQLIEIELHTLLQDLKYWHDSQMGMIEQAARLHHIAVKIHPFPNGNGRWARMLSNIWLKRNEQPIIEWPETVIGTASTIRGTYLDAVRAADRGDYAAWIHLHEQWVSTDSR